jgi:hypothetical protein
MASENVCLGNSITFTDKSTWATGWNWNFGDSATSTEENPPPHIYHKAGIYHVQLIVTADGGSDLLTQDVEVYPLPLVSFTPVPTYPTPVMKPNAQVKFYNTTQLGVKYLWDFGDNDTSSLIEPIHSYKDTGIYTVSLEAWTVNHCFDSTVMVKAVHVKGDGGLYYPNVFAPNTNGPSGGQYKSNYDKTIFYPKFPSGSIVEYHLEIYDRWGEKLFETNDVSIGWDGYYKGKLCKGDVYIWMAKGKFTNGQTFNLAGDVTLIK